MNTRACCMALVITAVVASPCGSGESAQDRDPLIDRAPAAGVATLISHGQWTDPQWQYRVQLLEPALRDAQRSSRNPAGRLVLPAPQTSHAPAF